MGTRMNIAATSITVATTSTHVIVKMWNPLDPVGSFLKDLAQNLRDWYASFLETIVLLVTTVATPTPEMLQNDFFSLALGGTYGLARILVAFVAVVVALVIVATPSLRHGMKIQRTIVSMILVILFGYMFYPVYSMLYDVSKAFTEGAVALISTNDVGVVEAILRLFNAANTADAISTIISTGISGVLGIFIVGNAIALWLTCVIVLIFYPLAIAIRPLGRFGNLVFNAFNAAILTTLIAPPIMAFTFMLPAYSHEFLPSISIVAAPFFAIVGSLLSMATPLVIFFLAFNKFTEVFGRLDDVSGKFDVGQMPPVSIEEVKNDVKVTNNNSTSAIIADVAGDSLLYGKDTKDIFDDIVKSGVNGAAAATAAAGHPYFGMAFKAAGGAYSNMRSTKHAEEASANEGGEKDD